MKNILLLGAGGFVGKNLLEHLSGNKELNLFHPSSKELNITNEEAVKKYLTSNHFDIVINAAVYNTHRASGQTGEDELEMDLKMFLNLEKYHNLYGKMFYFGSGAEFDKSRDIVSVKENEFSNGVPKTKYGIAKYTIGKMIEKSENVYNLRIFGLFGKYESWITTFISGACCKALKNKPITIRQNVYFDYLYINDFCKIIEWFIFNEPKHHTYNIVSGKKIDLITLAHIVKKVSGKDVPIIVKAEGLNNEYTASNERLLKEIGDFTFTSFEQAISELYKYYENIEVDIDESLFIE